MTSWRRAAMSFWGTVGLSILITSPSSPSISAVAEGECNLPTAPPEISN